MKRIELSSIQIDWLKTNYKTAGLKNSAVFLLIGQTTLIRKMKQLEIPLKQKAYNRNNDGLIEHQCLGCMKIRYFKRPCDIRNGFCRKCKSGKKQRGSNNPKWNGGSSGLHKLIRTCKKYETWRKTCFERDKYTCQLTGQIGGELEVHHKTRFSVLIKNFLNQYPDLNPTDNIDKLSFLSQYYQPFWDINNGITLNKEGHRKLHKRCV